MRLRWLGWAGVELEHGDVTLVIDPLHDAAAVFAPLVERPSDVRVPQLAAAKEGTAVAGLVTHLHRDHADAAALGAALAPGATVYEPAPFGGDALENLALAQADHELGAAGLRRSSLGAWESVSVGPFAITAVPAADGVGDPQVSWLVEAGGVRVLHLGDTMFHGFWWRIARRLGPFDAVLVPVNGAVVSFPHRVPSSPLPVALDPGQAAIAVDLLQARLAIPIHAEGYELDGVYRPVGGAAQAFAAAAAERGTPVRALAPGESIDLEPVASAAREAS